jgi:hypothetical protein
MNPLVLLAACSLLGGPALAPADGYPPPVGPYRAPEVAEALAEQARANLDAFHGSPMVAAEASPYAETSTSPSPAEVRPYAAAERYRTPPLDADYYSPGAMRPDQSQRGPLPYPEEHRGSYPLAEPIYQDDWTNAPARHLPGPYPSASTGSRYYETTQGFSPSPLANEQGYEFKDLSPPPGSRTGSSQYLGSRYLSPAERSYRGESGETGFRPLPPRPTGPSPYAGSYARETPPPVPGGGLSYDLAPQRRSYAYPGYREADPAAAGGYPAAVNPATGATSPPAHKASYSPVWPYQPPPPPQATPPDATQRRYPNKVGIPAASAARSPGDYLPPGEVDRWDRPAPYSPAHAPPNFAPTETFDASSNRRGYTFAPFSTPDNDLGHGRAGAQPADLYRHPPTPPDHHVFRDDGRARNLTPATAGKIYRYRPLQGGDPGAPHAQTWERPNYQPPQEALEGHRGYPDDRSPGYPRYR